uniref:Uncharacterized protein n=1 Tax=viral metagenome TaxID=1070528 RepID=A0A2V0RK77_9ZZZZ
MYQPNLEYNHTIMRKYPKTKRVLDKASEIAGEVETVAGSIRTGAEAASKKLGNDKHRATRAARPRDVIVRSRNSALPDIASRAFVDPLNSFRFWAGQVTDFDPTGVSAGSIVSDRFDDYVFTSYLTAIIQAVKFDISGTFTNANLSAYFLCMTNVLRDYYVLAYQRNWMLDADVIGTALYKRNEVQYGEAVESQLRVAKHMLDQFVLPPALHEMIKWYSAIYPLTRGPSGNVVQFMRDTYTTADTDADVAAALKTQVSSITTTDKIISSYLGKAFPSWRLKVTEYYDLTTNPELDFNYLNIWYNQGKLSTVPAENLPTDSVNYVLFNDNPNVMCTALSTIYDSSGAIWEPGFIEPYGTNLNSSIWFYNATTGNNTVITRADPALLAINRHMDFDDVDSAYTSAIPQPKAVSMTPGDLKADATSALLYLFHVDEVESLSRQSSSGYR